jgi:glycosyltransferase involved in cell wall biosynthesis
MALAAIISFRLGGRDGVSVEAAKWSAALELLGFKVRTVAGEGPVDRLVPGLAITAIDPPGRREVDRALEGADLVIVENLCSLPLNRAAGEVVAETCAGRTTVLHHHDLSWQRPHLGNDDPPPTDGAWRHVTINELSRRELAARGIEATTIYNRFDTAPSSGNRASTRAALGVADDERLFLQPTRALPRKNVGGAIDLCARLGATYWLLGPAEDGYGPELERLARAAPCRVILGPGSTSGSAADAYAACDLVVLPSTWEGFGNPSVESAVHRRALVIGPYPVAGELAEFGFEWFALDDIDAVARWLVDPEPTLLERNWAVADRYFSTRDLPDRLSEVLGTLPIAF